MKRVVGRRVEACLDGGNQPWQCARTLSGASTDTHFSTASSGGSSEVSSGGTPCSSRWAGAAGRLADFEGMSDAAAASPLPGKPTVVDFANRAQLQDYPPDMLAVFGMG
eukprot:TRINITY_DN20749_c0_g1_i1.p2 TRINITY_DN20749_c0_g1~~TRINITY_DN20749_c0_g1_i1.p2  ORF type:complete len:109 (+),score=12.23 TRINITY_DN20749_c0_g1_i1:218-544(+)